MNSDVTIIIRSVGERTEQLCKKLILEQVVEEAQVFVVREVPFSAAMRKSFEIGIHEGRKWTFCVDADVLLRPGSVAYMLNEAEKQAENTCEIQGLVIDKFFGGPRPAGNHLYKTSLLPEVIKRIPEEGVNIRPEHHALQSMAVDGYPWLQLPYILGTHDDEQFNRDIYRKCFVQGVKHLYNAELLITTWKNGLQSDSDFQVALKAFSDSIQYDGALYINVNQSIYVKGFKNAGFEEKGELDIQSLDGEKIEHSITSWAVPALYHKYFPDAFGLNKPAEKEQKKNRFQQSKEILYKKGIFSGLFYILSLALISLGYRMQRLL